MSILIWLLKILCIILALILIVVFIIIFSSINVKVNFDNKEKISYSIKVKYILGIFTYTLNSKDNVNYIKIFGINIERFKKNKDIPKNKEIEKEKKSEEKVYKVASINDNKDNVEKYLDKDINYDAKENINEGSIEEDDIEENKDKLTKFKEVIKNIKYKINYIKEKINFIISYPNKNQILNMIFLLLKSLIKAIKFKKIKINVDYGLDEPFKTGNVCAIISAIIPFLPKKYIKDIKIMPDFENELFLADLEIKCKSSLFKLLFPIIIFISKKPIREIIFSKGE